MLGYTSQAAAVKAYKSNFDKGWSVGSVTEMKMPEFKEWLNTGTPPSLWPLAVLKPR